MRFISILVLSLSLAACGFHLRGNHQLKFNSAFIHGNAQIKSKLSRLLKANQIAVEPQANNADIEIEILNEGTEKRILSLTGQGVVREYVLYYQVRYRTKAKGDKLWSEPVTSDARRDYLYSDANLLAAQSDEKRLNKAMQDEVANSIIRKLSILKR